jgi:hypothetical protein
MVGVGSGDGGRLQPHETQFMFDVFHAQIAHDNAIMPDLQYIVFAMTGHSNDEPRVQ